MKLEYQTSIRNQKKNGGSHEEEQAVAEVEAHRRRGVENETK